MKPMLILCADALRIHLQAHLVRTLQTVSNACDLLLLVLLSIN